MSEIYYNFNLLIHGLFGYLLYLYINSCSKFGSLIIKVDRKILPELSIGFILAMVFTFIFGNFGIIGFFIVLVFVGYFWIDSNLRKEKFFSFGDILFSIIYSLIIGHFIHGPSLNLNPGFIPGDTFTYANWISSLSEFPNKFNELMVKDLHFGNIIKIGHHGLSLIGSIFLKLNFINPIDFMIISVPLSGIIALKNSFEKHLQKLKNEKNYKLLNIEYIFYFLPAFALLPYPNFIIESPPILFSLALIYDCSAQLLRKNKLTISQSINSLFGIYTMYSTKLAVSPPFIIKLVAKNNFLTSTFFSFIFLFGGVIVAIGHWQVLPTIFNLNINIVAFCKVLLFIAYANYVSSIERNLIVLSTSILLFLFSYVLFNSTLAGTAFLLFAIKDDVKNKKSFKNNFLKLILITLSILSIFLSQPFPKLFILNILIISLLLLYNCLNYQFVGKILESKVSILGRNLSLKFKVFPVFILFLILLLNKPVFQCLDNCYPSKYSYLAYTNLNKLSSKDSLIFTDETGDNTDLNGGFNSFAGISRRQFYLAGWYNTALRNNNSEKLKMLETNKEITKMDKNSCSVLENITDRNTFLISREKRIAENIENVNGELIYENEEYQIIGLCR
tara:strand:- start:724 stop:2574 length:1851 start_codon:yes stop_codon:yes gene_type:complete